MVHVVQSEQRSGYFLEKKDVIFAEDAAGLGEAFLLCGDCWKWPFQL